MQVPVERARHYVGKFGHWQSSIIIIIKVEFILDLLSCHQRKGPENSVDSLRPMPLGMKKVGLGIQSQFPALSFSHSILVMGPELQRRKGLISLCHMPRDKMVEFLVNVKIMTSYFSDLAPAAG